MAETVGVALEGPQELVTLDLRPHKLLLRIIFTCGFYIL